MENQLDPLLGRQSELERVVQILCRRTKNNPVLIGEPGVGKKAIVKGLAQRIAEDSVPSRLGHKRVLDLDFSPIVVVTRQSGGFERRLMTILTELIEAQNVIIFVEDLYVLRGADGSLDAANVLKPPLSRGEIQCIASATPRDYDKSIGKEPWLEACFEAVNVPPSDEADAVQILFTIRGRYEMFHGVIYTDKALKFAVYYSNRYIPNRALEFEKARFYSDEERKERENLRLLYEKYNLAAASISTVTVEDIEEIVARWTRVPVATIRQERPATDPASDKGQS